MGELPNAGDLAMVVRTHECGYDVPLGMIAPVLELRQGAEVGLICRCGSTFARGDALARLMDLPFGCWIPQAWLRKIPPLSEPERIQIADEIEREKRKPVTADVVWNLI